MRTYATFLIITLISTTITAGELVEWRPTARKPVTSTTHTARSMVENTTATKSTAKIRSTSTASHVRTNSFVQPYWVRQKQIIQSRQIIGDSYRICPGGKCNGR